MTTIDEFIESRMSILRLMAELPVRNLPPDIVRWRINRKRDDGTWEPGDWVDGAPLRPVHDGPRNALLEYEMRLLGPRRVTVLGDRARTWPPDMGLEP